MSICCACSLSVIWARVVSLQAETDGGFHRGASIDLLSQFSNEQEGGSGKYRIQMPWFTPHRLSRLTIVRSLAATHDGGCAVAVLFPPCTMLEVKVAIKHPLGTRGHRWRKHAKTVRTLLRQSSQGSHKPTNGPQAEINAGATSTGPATSKRSECGPSLSFGASRPNQPRPPAVSFVDTPTTVRAANTVPPPRDRSTSRILDDDWLAESHDVTGIEPAVLDSIMIAQAVNNMDPYRSLKPWDVHDFDVKDGITEDGKTYMAISVLPSFL